MKKILLSALAVFAFGAANAQEKGGFGFSKGNVLVEGNLSVKSVSVPDGSSTKTTTSYGFAPVGGFFVTDKLAVGLGLDIRSDKGLESTGPSASVYDLDTFGVGAFGRYYFLDLGQRFKVYGQGTLGYTSYKAKYTRNDVKSSAFGFRAGLGVNYFLTNSIAINFAVSDVLSISHNKPESGDGNTTVNLNVNNFSNFFTTSTFGLTFKF